MARTCLKTSLREHCAALRPLQPQALAQQLLYLQEVQIVVLLAQLPHQSALDAFGLLLFLLLLCLSLLLGLPL